MPTIEAHLRREMHKYAVELRKLAYTLPNGVGEHDLLELSQLMNIAADETPPEIQTVANTSAQGARQPMTTCENRVALPVALPTLRGYPTYWEMTTHMSV